MALKPVIGLAGGIGSGKTTVARLLREAGAAVVDSDELNLAQLHHPDVRRELQSWWGNSILDGSGELDRKRIAEIIFRDPNDRRRLERLVHPRIARERERLIERHQCDPQVRAIVLDTPLLVESNLDERCDAVIFVEADEEVRRRRVVERRGWSTEEWARREKSQNALDKKKSRADYVVVNNSSDLAQLRADVHALFERVILEASSKRQRGPDD